MNDQPTGEWTPEWIRKQFGRKSGLLKIKQICDAHNAAIAAANEVSDQPKPTSELVARITEYLSVGGLFNPELMEHEKVRDLLMDCRDALTQPKPTTDEWTEDTVRRIEFINSDQRYDAIADAHNAAIAAANEDTEKYRSNCLYWKEQLAAERESHEKELDVVEANWSAELAAERGNLATVRELRELDQKEIHQLREQLAATQKRYDDLYWQYVDLERAQTPGTA